MFSFLGSNNVHGPHVDTSIKACIVLQPHHKVPCRDTISRPIKPILHRWKQCNYIPTYVDDDANDRFEKPQIA
jgi:hypothetical protein